MCCIIYQHGSPYSISQIASGPQDGGNVVPASSSPSISYIFCFRKHEHARAAAAAIECARADDGARRLYLQLLAGQNMLTTDRVFEVARESGVSDISEFRSFMVAQAPKILKRHEGLSRALNVAATPTVVINGWIWTQPPTLRGLFSVACTSGSTSHAATLSRQSLDNPELSRDRSGVTCRYRDFNHCSDVLLAR